MRNFFKKRKKEWTGGVVGVASFQPLQPKKEEDEINKIWNEENILKICPGKDLLKLINKWLVDEYQINISPKELIEYSKTVDDDIKNLINRIINVGKN